MLHIDIYIVFICYYVTFTYVSDSTLVYVARATQHTYVHSTCTLTQYTYVYYTCTCALCIHMYSIRMYVIHVTQYTYVCNTYDSIHICTLYMYTDSIQISMWCMYSQSHLGCHFESSKLKAQTSLLPRFSEKRRSSFELWALKQHSKMSPQVGLAVPVHCTHVQYTCTPTLYTCKWYMWFNTHMYTLHVHWLHTYMYVIHVTQHTCTLYMSPYTYVQYTCTRFCQVEMKNPTRLSNKTNNAWSCAENQILENKNLRNMILNICTER